MSNNCNKVDKSHSDDCDSGSTDSLDSRDTSDSRANGKFTPFEHFVSLYPNLPQTMKNKIQITQNKCIQYCLELDKKTYISKNEFEILNWLPVKDRFN